MERLLAVIVLRASVAWAAEVSANRCSARVKSMTRAALVEHTARLGPGRRADGMGGGGRAGGTRGRGMAALTTRSIDALDGYFARYLLQVLLAVIVPLLVFAAVLGIS